MQSKAVSVDMYLREVPQERAETLTLLRQICLEELRDFKETMRYGMPSYERNGVAEVSFASQKNFVALYILKQDVMLKYKDDLKDVSMGKGCIRFTRPGKLDYGIIRKMLADTYASAGRIC